MMNNDYSKETDFLKRIERLFKSVRLVKGNGCSVGYAKAFKSNSDFTEFISRVVAKVAKELGLRQYREYYTLDHVLYSDEDRIPEGILPFESSHVHGTWLKHIRIAIEHENSLDGAGGFQELAKLMLFNADFKVLMGYAYKGDNYDDYAKEYHAIYKSVDLASGAKPILFIGEYGDAHLDAYLITVDGLLKYQCGTSTWTFM